MFIKMVDAETGKTWYVNASDVVLIEDVGGEYLVSFAEGRPVAKSDRCRTIRLTGQEAKALLAYVEANLWKGGGH